MPNNLEKDDLNNIPRMIDGGDTLLFADPVGGKMSGGVSIDRKTIEDFGDGNWVFGASRISLYLVAMLREHGTILPALGILNGTMETASRMTGFENATTQEEMKNWSKKLQARDGELIGELLNNVEAWEKSQENN